MFKCIFSPDNCGLFEQKEPDSPPQFTFSVIQLVCRSKTCTKIRADLLLFKNISLFFLEMLEESMLTVCISHPEIFLASLILCLGFVLERLIRTLCSTSCSCIFVDHFYWEQIISFSWKWGDLLWVHFFAETPVNPPTVCTRNTSMHADTHGHTQHTHTQICSLLKNAVRFINIKAGFLSQTYSQTPREIYCVDPPLCCCCCTPQKYKR